MNPKLETIIRETLIERSKLNDNLFYCTCCGIYGSFNKNNVFYHITLKHPSVITAIEKAFEEGEENILQRAEKLKESYENKMVLTGQDVTLLGTKCRFLHIWDFWDMFKELNQDGLNNKEV